MIGATICAYLLSQLVSNAITLGVSWLVLGVGGPGPDHPRLQGGAAGDDGNRKGNGRGRLRLVSL
ncbi:hypothetical protein QFZ40_002992 [Arthrobacter pascens]|uniref:hypothetical protein n=1 Tax=Arthrobacter pascens TaxID=1677 RepID=UPI002780D9D9|nr:hypothetical protein [Arthrobacter pascens]MDQ0635083.1 hypothetical protein [Arthrobacter pascens]